MPNNVGLLSPWVIYVKRFKALFGQDPDIRIEFNEDANELVMFVEDPVKAAALEELLPETVDFGGVELYITVVPANSNYTLADLYKMAFNNNPVFEAIETVSGEGLFPASYCIFKNEVVQYMADDLSSYYGVQSTLYEDIADEIFEDNHDGVYFCTGLV